MTTRCAYCHYIEGHQWGCPESVESGKSNPGTCPSCNAAFGELHKSNCELLFKAKSNEDWRVMAPKEANSVITRNKASELLKHTDELINGERSKDYGDPHQSFQNIAELWSTYLGHEITVTDVGMMMILLKVARNGRGRNKPDNFVDICGYASLTGSQVFSKDKK